MDVFEQLRWLAKEQKRAIETAIILAAHDLFNDWIGRHGFNESIANFSATLVKTAHRFGGEAKALQLKQMMEEANQM